MNEPPTQRESELVDFVRAIDVRAPQELHRRVQALVAERAPSRRRRQAAIRWGLCGAVALAALAAVLAVSVSGGGGSTLTLRTTVALTLRPATMAAPVENPHNGAMLAASVDGVAFPYWAESFGWRSTGARSDRVDRRTVKTVFYADDHGHWIGYAIVAGTPAPPVGGGVVEWRGATPYRSFTQDGAQVVTWLRHGHLCVVAGHGVSAATLLALASWRGHRTLAA
jgi:hypothetical protein